MTIAAVETARPLTRYISQAQLTTLITTVRKVRTPAAARDAALIDCLYCSACRIDEFLKSSLDDVKRALVTGQFWIPAVRRKGKFRDHTAFVTDRFRSALKALLAARDELTGTPWDRYLPDQPLVVSASGERLTVRAVQKRFKLWAAAAGLPPEFSPHWLRHTRAMAVMRASTARDPRRVVQEVLGHSHFGSTAIYTGVTHEEIAEALVAADFDGRRQRRRAAGRGVMA